MAPVDGPRGPWWKQRRTMLEAAGAIVLVGLGALAVSRATADANARADERVARVERVERERSAHAEDQTEFTEDRLAKIESDAAAAEKRADAASEKAAAAQREAEAAVKANEELGRSLDTRQQELDERATALDVREHQVKQREDAATLMAAAAASSVSAGLHEVGPDLPAGRYRTDGGAGCAYVLLTPPQADGFHHVISEGGAAGPTTIDITSPWLELKGPCAWTRAG